MSILEEKKVFCPDCAKWFKTVVWTGVDVQVNPELILKLLEGKLNVWVCPKCRYETQIVTEMYWHDMDRSVWICMTPRKISEKEKNKYTKELHMIQQLLKDDDDYKNFAKLKALPQEITSFPDSLKDKIRYSINRKLLVFKGVMSEEEKDRLLGLSSEGQYKRAVEELFRGSQFVQELYFVVGYEGAKQKLLEVYEDME